MNDIEKEIETSKEVVLRRYEFLLGNNVKYTLTMFSLSKSGAKKYLVTRYNFDTEEKEIIHYNRQYVLGIIALSKSFNELIEWGYTPKVVW